MNLDIFFYGSMNEKTGAGKIVKSFHDMKENIYRCGFDNISIIDNEIVEDTNATKSIRIRIKKKLLNILDKTAYGQYLHIKKNSFDKAETLVCRYFSENRYNPNNILVFHEMFSCYAYITHCLIHNLKLNKYVLIEHNNGNPWKMLLLTYPLLRNTKYEKILDKVARMCEDKAERIVLVSNESLHELVSTRPEYAAKAVTIPNGIDCIENKCAKKLPIQPIKLVTVGTVCHRKNQISIIRALSKIEYNVQLTIVGGGPEVNECIKCAKENHIFDKISFIGPSNNVFEYLNNADVFILPSFDEGLPVSGIEALSCGLPLILSDVGGNKELVEGNGILIEPTVDSIVLGINYIIDNLEQFEEMSLNSLRLFRDKYTINAMINGYCRLFDNIINAN